MATRNNVTIPCLAQAAGDVLHEWVASQRIAKVGWDAVLASATAAGLHTTKERLRADFLAWQKSKGEDADADDEATVTATGVAVVTAAAVESDEGPEGELTEGQLAALQFQSAIQGDFRLAVATAAYQSGQRRLRSLKATWDAQIQELADNWSPEDAEMLRVYIRGQRPALIQLFISMNPAAAASRTEREMLVRQVDALLARTLARVVEPEVATAGK